MTKKTVETSTFSHDFWSFLDELLLPHVSLQHHCSLFYSMYWFKSIFCWSSTGFDCHAWNLNYSEVFQLKDSPCEGSANRVTIPQGTKIKAFCFTTVHGTRDVVWTCYPIRYLWSLKTKTLPDQPNWGVHRAADAIGSAISMWWLLIPSKENNWVFVRWVGGKSALMSAIWLN